MNKTTISLNSSSSSNCIFLIFRLICVFVLGSSDIGVALVFESSLFGNGIKNNLQGSSFFTVRVFWGTFWWFVSSFWCIGGSFGVAISFSFIFSLSQLCWGSRFRSWFFVFFSITISWSSWSGRSGWSLSSSFWSLFFIIFFVFFVGVSFWLCFFFVFCLRKSVTSAWWNQLPSSRIS